MTIRILGLGNELLADDAFGVEVVRRVAADLPAGVETATSIAGGLALLDDVVGVDRLMVVDSLATGDAPPGTVRRFEARDLEPAPGPSAHYVGMFEALQLGRALGLAVPSQVVILGVEAADCLTVGAPMSPAMRAAIPLVAGMIHEQVANWQRG